MVSFARHALVAWMLVNIVGAPACAPNREQWMSRAASQQAALATAGIGNEQTVRAQARQAAQLLSNLSAAFLSKPPPGSQQLVAAFARDALEVSSGLREIADSQTDKGFTNAVFGMCDPAVQSACPHVGQVMVVIAAGMTNNPPANLTPEQRQAAINYFETFGSRLISIPTKCAQASGAMAEASAEEQQAEVEHQANVNRALTAAAVTFAGAVVFAGTVGAAAATRPPVTENNFYNNQFYGY